MSETRTQPRAHQYRKAKSGEGGTPIKRFYRRLFANPELNAKGRGLLQMKRLSSKQPFTMGADEQARQLGVSRWVVNDLRRLAVETGLFVKTEDGYYEQTPPERSFTARFRACELMDLGVRLASVIIDMYAGSKDGWAHPSLGQLAVQLGSERHWISNRISWLVDLTDKDRLKLFEVKREPGRRNAYRPIVDKQTADKGTESARPGAPTVDDIVNGLFNGSKVLAGAFKSDILVRAVKLHLGNASETELAAALSKLYCRVGEARGGAKAARGGMPGPLEVLRLYVGWLADQDWIGAATVRVLRFDSPSFDQWRRDMAMHYGCDCDPVTGKSRW